MSTPILIDRTEADLIEVLVAGYEAAGFDTEDAVAIAEVAVKAMKDDRIKFQRGGYTGYRLSSGGAI